MTNWLIGAAALSLALGCAGSRSERRDGTLARAGVDSLQITAPDHSTLELQITRSTAVIEDGRAVRLSQLSPGEDVRASYRVVDGRPEALRIEATRGARDPRKDPAMMQRSPGDQEASDDKEPPAQVLERREVDPHLASPNG